METVSRSLLPIGDWQRVLRGAFALTVSVSITGFSLIGQADAATYTWDANGAASGVTDGAGIWNTTAGNTLWWDGLTNSVWSNAPVQDAIFGSGNGAAGTVNIGSAVTVGNLTFNPASSGNYTLQGAANVPANTITLSGANPIITTNASATIAALINSTNGFIKEGLGTLTLRGSSAGSTLNVIPGTVTVSAGTLVVGPSLDSAGGQGALQGDLTLRNFARFRAVQGPYLSNTGVFTVQADAYAEINAFGEGVGVIAGAGRIQIATGSTLQVQTGTRDFSGVISGAGSLRVDGGIALVQTLSGANLHSGETNVIGGTLALNHVDAVRFSTLNQGVSGSVTFTLPGANTYHLGALGGAGGINLGGNTISVGGSNLGALADTVLSGAGGVTKVGTGTQTFRAAQLYTGRTTLSGGRLELVSGGTISGSSTIIFNGTSELTINGGNKTVGTVNRSAGNATFNSTYNNANTSLTVTSLPARAAGATANFVVSGGTNGSSNKIVVNSAAPDVFIDHGTFFGGDNFAWNDAGGYVRALRYSGPADPLAVTTAGGVTLPSARYQETTGAVTAQTDVEFTTLKINGAHAFTLAAGQVLNVNGLLKTGANATLSGGAFIRPSPSADLVVRTPAASDALTINTVIRDNSGSALVKSGLGSLTLGALAVNSYTGGTFLNEGTLIVTQDSNLGGTGAENNVKLNGGTLQPAASFTLDPNHGLDIGPGGGAIFGNGFGLTLGSANMLSGSGPFAITGSSPTNTILTSAATQDYTGPMTLGAASFFAGRIALGADNLFNPFGTGDITVISGAAGSAVYVNRPGSVWNNRFFISGNGAEGRGVLRTEQGGTFQGDIILTGNASISSDGAGTTTVLRGNISGPFTLTLGGRTGANAANQYVVTGNNVHSATIVGLGITNIDHDVALGAYHGTTTIQTNATLQAGAAGIILNPDRTLALTGGGLHYLDAQNFGLTVQGPITGGTSDTLVLRGSGHRLSATSSYAGATVIEGSIVIVDTLANAGAPSSLGQGSPTPSAADLTLRDATLVVSRPGTTDRLFTLGGSGAAVEATTGLPQDLVNWTNPNPIALSGTAAQRLVLGGTSTLIFTPGIPDGGTPQNPLPTGLTKTGSGIAALNGHNPFTGTTVVEEGTLELWSPGALAGTSGITVQEGGTLLFANTTSDDSVNDMATMTLDRGTLGFRGNAREGSSPGIGALTLSASSIIDFANGDGSLHFSDSHAATWSGTLAIYNWASGSDHLLFGTVDHPWNLTDGGLTTSQLAQIAFFSGAGTGFLGTGGFLAVGFGEIAPVPEPSGVFAGLALFGLAGWRERRKSQARRRESRCAA